MTRNLPILVAVLSLAVTACDGNDHALLGTLERDRLELIAEGQETIVSVTAREGDTVKAGQVLVQLDTASASALLDHARANATQAERRHAENLAGARKEQVAQARAVAAGAAARLDAESKEYDRIEKLVSQKLLPANALDRQRAVRDSASAEDRAARDRLAEFVNGTRSEVIEQSAAALAAARAEVAEFELALDRYTVRAPRDGSVDALPYKLGERPPKGAPVIVMLAAGAPYARVFVPEPQRTTVAPGSQATVRIDGSDRDWSASVRYVSAEAAFTPYYALNERQRSRLAFLAEVTLTDPEAASLPTGIPVEVSFSGSQAVR